MNPTLSSHDSRKFYYFYQVNVEMVAEFLHVGSIYFIGEYSSNQNY